MNKSDKITFYSTPGKTYKPAVMTWPSALKNALELSQIQENIGIIIESAEELAARNPVLYVCRDKAIIRLDRYTYANVEIPGNLAARLRHTASIELTLVRSAHSLENYCAKVEHLLCFPDYMTEKPTRGNVLDMDWDFDDLERPMKPQDDTITVTGDLFNNADGTSGDNDSGVDDSGVDDCDWPRTSPRRMFEAWLAEKGGTILEESRDSEYVLACDGRKPLLVSFFDQVDNSWMASEEPFIDGAPPFWASRNRHVVSPVFRLFVAASCISQAISRKVVPLMIMSDHINIINAEEMTDLWAGMEVELCYCTRSESFADTFEHTLGRSTEDMDPADLDKVKQAFHTFLLQNDKRTP